MTVGARSACRPLTLVSWLLTALACPAFAADSIVPCPDVFDNGVTSNGGNVKMTFERDAQLLNAPTTLLNFNNIKKDNKSSQLTCDSADCSAGGTVSETIDPGPFQPSVSNLDFDAPDDGTTLNQPAYDEVKVDSGTTLNVDPAIDEYFIDKLEVDQNATIILQPGDYWIDDLKLEKGSQLVVAGSGTARIYVNKLKIEDDVLVNSPSPGVSGDPSKLFLYAYDEDIKLGEDSTFSGFLYGDNKIETEKRVAIFGALSAGKNVKLDDNSFVSYDAGAVVNADFGCLCSCVNSTLLDYLSIGASPIGVTCEAQTITVTAILSDGSVHDTYGGTISLSTSTGLGDWVVIGGAGSLIPGAANSGNASYTFAAADLGRVSLGLLHQTTGIVNIDVVDTDGISELSNSAPPDDPDIDMRDAALRFYADGVADAIGLQISGKASSIAPGAQNITLRAVIAGTDTNECQSRLPVGTHSIELGYQCVDPAVCSSVDAMTVNGSTIASNGAGPVSNLLPVNLPFALNGGIIEAPLDLRHLDAGRTTLHARKALPADAQGPAATLLGSSSSFVVRPFALGFNSIISGAVANPGGTAGGGGGFTTAGSTFAFDVGAYRYDAADDLDADGIMDAGSDPTNNGTTPAFSAATDLLVSAITPAGGSAGAFAPGNLAAGAFSSGVATVPSAGYAEVGSIVLRASSLDYLGDPAADILGFSPEIGRFYPDYFELLLDAVSPSCTVGASSYTYMDEPALGIDYRLLARNAAGQTTLNYDTTLGYAAGQVRYHAEDSDDGVDLSARVSAGAGAWELGSYVRPSATAGYTASDARFSRAATEDGPYRQLQIGLSVFAEPDGRNLSILDMDPATAGDCGAAGTCSATMVGTPAEVRFGRLRVLEAYGPETLNLPVPILTEYFDGTGFVRNTDDGNGITACTRLPLSSVDLQTGTALGTPIPVGAGTSIGTMSYITGTDFFFSSGDAALILSAPGVGNTGAITVDVDLTTHPWLRFDWDGDGMNDDDPPQASGVFGRYRGHDRIIYWSEQR